MKNKQYKFVCQYDNFEVDILFINSSQYCQTKIDNQFDIIFFYNPANKTVYLQPIKSKSPEETSKTIEPFMLYNDSLYKDDSRDKNLFNTIVTDLGTEFKGKFQQELDEYGIQHQLVPLNMLDHLQLSPLNSMCQYIRQFIFKTLDKNNIKILTIEILQKICDQANEYFNKIHKSTVFIKTPQNVTRDDVDQYNYKALNKNKLIEVKNDFHIGDIVQIKTKRQQFEKIRVYQFTKCSYKIVQNLGRQFVLQPLNFNRQTLIECLKQRQSNIDLCTKPCYIRKYYELKQSKDNQQYDPYEVETPLFCEFNKIYRSYKKEGQRLYPYEDDYQEFKKVPHDQQYYFIYADQKQQKPVNISQLRFLNVNQISNAEIDFWLFQNKKDNDQIYIYKI